jgi:hypothetical protein
MRRGTNFTFRPLEKMGNRRQSARAHLTRAVTRLQAARFQLESDRQDESIGFTHEDMEEPVTKARAQRAATVGVAEHGNSAMLVTIDPLGELLDRREVDLTHDLPTHPYHHEGSWAVGRYADSPWARTISLPDAVALVERVREAAARGARESLEKLASAVPMVIESIAIRVCPPLPATTIERIKDTRAANVADSVMYREALATAAESRGWSVRWYDREQVFGQAAAALGSKDIDKFLTTMGKSVGPPWQAKHKLAAAAALAARAPQGRSK